MTSGEEGLSQRTHPLAHRRNHNRSASAISAMLLGRRELLSISSAKARYHTAIYIAVCEKKQTTGERKRERDGKEETCRSDKEATKSKDTVEYVQ